MYSFLVLKIYSSSFTVFDKLGDNCTLEIHVVDDAQSLLLVKEQQRGKKNVRFGPPLTVTQRGLRTMFLNGLGTFVVVVLFLFYFHQLFALTVVSQWNVNFIINMRNMSFFNILVTLCGLFQVSSSILQHSLIKLKLDLF